MLEMFGLSSRRRGTGRSTRVSNPCIRCYHSEHTRQEKPFGGEVCSLDQWWWLLPTPGESFRWWWLVCVWGGEVEWLVRLPRQGEFCQWGGGLRYGSGVLESSQVCTRARRRFKLGLPEKVYFKACFAVFLFLVFGLRFVLGAAGSWGGLRPKGHRICARWFFFRFPGFLFLPLNFSVFPQSSILTFSFLQP